MKLHHPLLLLLIGLVEPTTSQTIFDYEQKIAISADFGRQEISFTNPENGFNYTGTLIYPNTNFDKVVLIVPGSGKDTRHAHFDIAEEFLFNQIAVYRFDERGIGQSDGKYKWDRETASSLEKDVISAYEKLRSLEVLSNKKIGVLGHSLGGIASIGAFGKGCDFDFLIQMATPVENKGAFLQYQAVTNIADFYTVKGKTIEEAIDFLEQIRKIAQPEEDYKATRKKAKAIIKQLDFRKGKHMINPVIIDLMKQQHEETYAASRSPILYIIGSMDHLVSSENEIRTLERMNNPNITVSLVPAVDHYLNDEKLPGKEYSSPYRMSKKALKKIIDWTLDQ